MFATKFLGLFHKFLANVRFFKRSRLAMNVSISKHDANKVKLQQLSCVDCLSCQLIWNIFSTVV